MNTNKQIIPSLLDNDLYKFCMQQVAFHNYKDVDVSYRFVNRGNTEFSFAEIEKIRDEINKFSKLRFSNAEISYLRTLPFFKEDYLTFLQNFELNANDVIINIDGDGINSFVTLKSIEIKGKWVNTILYEVPVLAIINEVHNLNAGNFSEMKKRIGLNNLYNKIFKIDDYVSKINLKDYCNFSYSDFGTRRRYSHEWQDTVISTLVNCGGKSFSGTSNVYFAKKYGCRPIGTMAHEFLQAHQVLSHPITNFQSNALKVWKNEYNDKLLIALTDTINIKSFLNDFNKELTEQYNGLRQDSGNPILVADEIIAHYKKLGINPKEKTIVFSDALTVDNMIDLHKYYGDKINVQFGIGTNLTNDVGDKPLNVVIKLCSVNNLPVIKISDTPGKLICTNEYYTEYIKSIFNIK